MSKPLRRTRRDLIATGVIAGVSALLVGTAFFTAPVRQADLSPAAEAQEDFGQLAVVPSSLSEGFRLTDTSGRAQPLVANGLIITYNDHTLTATNPEGETVWTYERPNDLCLMDQAWDKVVAVYRDNAGCGDVVAIDAKTGQYAGTRSAPASENVTRLASNDRIGYASSERIEVWRSDMVRTMEYGYIEAPQESDMQPNPGCVITSALTRTELVALTETCGDGTFLRIQKATPEDSREPEVDANIEIDPQAYLVAVSQDAAAVYDPSKKQVLAYDKEGNNTSSSSVPAMGEPQRLDGTIAVLPVADLPHHMSYWQDDSLLLMEPAGLGVTGVFQGALGTGFAAGDRLLYASQDGIAVVDWDKNAVDEIIPVDRGGYTGPVHISSAGATIVEKRGDDIAVLDAKV